MNGVYILRCGDGSLYTGWTNDLPRRLKAHQAGKGGRYTRSHLPVALAYESILTAPLQSPAFWCIIGVAFPDFLRERPNLPV